MVRYCLAWTLGLFVPLLLPVLPQGSVISGLLILAFSAIPFKSIRWLFFFLFGLVFGLLHAYQTEQRLLDPELEQETIQVSGWVQARLA